VEGVLPTDIAGSAAWRELVQERIDRFRSPAIADWVRD
jgi:hypothetical protein